ncbi:MAG: alkaline phosphatase, partial [Sarcina sp.]
MSKHKLVAIIVSLGLTVSLLAGCNNGGNVTNKAGEATTQGVNQNQEYKKPKYVFTFIGDGMSAVQLNAARVALGANEKEIKPGALTVDSFPVVGSATTHDSTSFAPDSASTATAMSTGVKTHSGVIG